MAGKHKATKNPVRKSSTSKNRSEKTGQILLAFVMGFVYGAAGLATGFFLGATILATTLPTPPMLWVWIVACGVFVGIVEAIVKNRKLK